MEVERLRMRAMEAAIKIYCCAQGAQSGSPGDFANTIGFNPDELEEPEFSLMDVLKVLQKQILKSIGVDPV